ncbi:MAG: helix-turn-helix domain-containing protein [Saprospiraceae bacterium]|nr:helix-turn-helix domain-containing protein [Saprospiraceae bacterium]
MDNQSQKIIFGLKIKQLRKEQNLSFSQLSELSGMSISYLNEIEKGKKYPREDKIEALAEALNTTVAALTSSELGKKLAPLGELLKSNFLNELPLDLFGLDAGKIVELLANAPTKIGAFITTLVSISRRYALEQENFYFAALRSYQALHDNYFEEIEEKADEFVTKNNLPVNRAVPTRLLNKILKSKYRYRFEEMAFGEAFQELNRFRSIYLPDKKLLMVNNKLTETQRAFLLGKELAFNALKLKTRIYTSTFVKVNSFEEVLNNFKAAYFSGAILMNRESLLNDLNEFFSNPKWNSDDFVVIMNKYKASPEMFFHRLISIIPKYFGLDNIFFIRFNNRLSTSEYHLTKELHLNREHQPYGNALLEHYCRRWITVWMLQDLQSKQIKENYTGMLAGIQRSRFNGSNDEYLCFNDFKTCSPNSRYEH